MSEAAQKALLEPDEKILEKMEAVITGKSTLGQLRGLKSNDMEAIYSVAHSLYKQKRYADAEKMFRFLCLYGHLDQRFWTGLAASLQQQKKFREAVDAYSYNAILDVKNPQNPLSAAYCYLALGEFDQADNGVEGALHWAGDKKEYASIRVKAEALRAAIKQKKGEKAK